MIKIEYTEKIYSFYQLISEYKIEIPIIQRDYAQGRIDKTEIRNNFLSALFQSMQPESPRLKLDFIYGSMINGCFQPLDGQQRLTTLFLLHWYAALKENRLDKNAKDILSRFTYETRISSRDFCIALISNHLEIGNFDAKENNLSDSIIDSPWFFLSWKKDPTINAMLRTIDDINAKFSNVIDLWNRLTSPDSPIYFYFVQLENIGLTDDLYIKMNARGKLLSPFENFKASLQKYVQDNNWEKNCHHNNTFAFKIDTEWTDLFWEYFKFDDSIDEPLMRFISTISMIRLSIEKTEAERLSWIRKLHDNANIMRPTLLTKDGYEYIYRCFELYRSKIKDLESHVVNIPLWRHNPSVDFLNQIVNPSQIASYSQKILFYAQTEYLLRNKNIDIDKFSEWIRVIRNIIARANIDAAGKRPDIVRSPETFDGAIGLVSELADGCSDIYLYLSSDRKINSSFAKKQIEEERVKAKLIMNDNDYKSIVWRLEDTDLLMGCIDFALFCCDFNGNIEGLDKEKMNAVSNVISSIFGKDKDISSNIRRALLTIDNNGQYEYYNYWWSYWYVGDAQKRCLIDKFRELEYCIYHDECRVYLKKLVEKLTVQTLDEIIDNFIPPLNMPNWKIRLIKEKKLLDSNHSNYIAIPNHSNFCYLLKSKRPREIDGNCIVE